MQVLHPKCAGLDVQLLLSLGNRGAAWDGPTPANALVVPFAPQLRLLDRAAVRYEQVDVRGFTVVAPERVVNPGDVPAC